MIENLEVEQDVKKQLTNLRDGILEYDDFSDFRANIYEREFEDRVTKELRFGVKYIQHPAVYFQGLHTSDIPHIGDHEVMHERDEFVASTVYKTMADHGFPTPAGNPDIGVQTNRDDGEIWIENSVNLEEVMMDGGLAVTGTQIVGPVALSLLPFVFAGLVDLGEEYLIKNSMDTTFDIGLYDDSTDSLSDTNDLADITTEPGGASYARQSEAFSPADISGNWGIDNDAQISWDLSDSTSGDIDSWFAEKNFTAVDTGDGVGTDHVIWFGSLSQTYSLSNVDTFNVAAGDAELTVN